MRSFAFVCYYLRAYLALKLFYFFIVWNINIILKLKFSLPKSNARNINKWMIFTWIICIETENWDARVRISNNMIMDNKIFVKAKRKKNKKFLHNLQDSHGWCSDADIFLEFLKVHKSIHLNSFNFTVFFSLCRDKNFIYFVRFHKRERNKSITICSTVLKCVYFLYYIRVQSIRIIWYWWFLFAIIYILFQKKNFFRPHRVWSKVLFLISWQKEEKNSQTKQRKVEFIE